MPTPEPQQVRLGRDRVLEGDRLREYRSQARPFFCRSCGKEQVSRMVPAGWYTLSRAPGSVELKPHRLGLYCSIRCLETMMPRLVGIEDDLGDSFDAAPSAFRQRPS